jgi:hypothetical protein
VGDHAVQVAHHVGVSDAEDAKALAFDVAGAGGVPTLVASVGVTVDLNY